MENKTYDFDSVFSNSNLQLLKVLFPMMPPENRPAMAIMIRCMEFRQTIYTISHEGYGHVFDLDPLPDGDALLDYLSPYLSESQKKEFDHFKQMLQQFQQMQDMMEMANELKDLFPEGMDSQGMDISHVMDLFTAMKGD